MGQATGACVLTVDEAKKVDLADYALVGLEKPVTLDGIPSARSGGSGGFSGATLTQTISSMLANSPAEWPHPSTSNPTPSNSGWLGVFEPKLDYASSVPSIFRSPDFITTHA